MIDYIKSQGSVLFFRDQEISLIHMQGRPGERYKAKKVHIRRCSNKEKTWYQEEMGANCTSTI